MQVPHFEVFWTDGYLVRRTGNAKDFAPPKAISLLDSSGLSFSIAAPRPQIESLHVRIANVLNADPSIVISIELRCANEILASQTSTLQQARRRGRIELDLRGTTLEKDRRYDVLIRPIDRRRAVGRSFRFLMRSCAMKAYWTVGAASLHLTRMLSRPARKAYRRSLKAGVLWSPLARAESRRGYSIAIPTADITADGLLISESLAGVRSQAARLDLFASRRRADRQQMGVIVLPDLKFDAGQFLAWLRKHAANIAWTVKPVSEMSAQIKALVEADIVVFVHPPWLQDPNQRVPGCEQRAGDLLWSLHLAGVCTILADATPGMAPDTGRATMAGPARRTLSQGAQSSALYHAYLRGTPDGDIGISSADPALLPAGNGGPTEVSALIARVSKRFWPRVAVVATAEAAGVNCVPLLTGLADQSYCGEVDVFVAGPGIDKERDVAGAVKIVPATGDSAPCWSIASQIQADLYIFLDASGTVDRDFIAAHVTAHWFDTVDVAIGSTRAAQPGADDADLIPAKSSTADHGDVILPDTMQRDAFVNLASGNVSIKRRCVVHTDEPPKPVANGSSGGSSWIELGLCLYERGAQFVFAPDAILTRRALPSGGANGKVSAGALNALLRARPDFGRIAGRWLACQADRLSSEADQAAEAERSEVDALRREIKTQLDQAAPLVQVCRGRSRRLRILSFRWHVAHQYEIYKLPHDFTLVTRLGLGLSDAWDFRARPLPENVRFAKATTIDPRDFDAAILHFDENVLSPELTDGGVPAEWGTPLRWFLENVDLPKVAICHGTPPFVGQWGVNPDSIESFAIYEDVQRKLVTAFRNIEVIVNSWQAQREWGFAKSRVIWHGFDPQQFPPATRVRDVISHGADYRRPHYRGRHAFEKVASLLPPDIAISGYERPDVPLLPQRSNAYGAARFRAYVDHVRQFKAYLNTTLRSPMPRSRGEAMMCGVVPVSLRNHDVDMFIRSGENGFIADEPEALADFLTFLCRNPAECARIGATARDTALTVFNHDRFLSTWAGLLHDLTR